MIATANTKPWDGVTALRVDAAIQKGLVPAELREQYQDMVLLVLTRKHPAFGTGYVTIPVPREVWDDPSIDLWSEIKDPVERAWEHHVEQTEAKAGAA